MSLATACRTLVWVAGLAGLATAQAAAPVLVGMTVPLTGPQAAFGTALRDGALLAGARANAAGGVGGRPIELAVRDDGGDPRRAAANASRLLEAGVVAISGVLGDAATVAVAETLAPAGDGPALAALVAPVMERLQFELTRIALRPVAVVHLAADGTGLAVQRPSWKSTCSTPKGGCGTDPLSSSSLDTP